MNQTDKTDQTSPSAQLERLLETHHIILGERQQQRLSWLVERYGEPVVWDRRESHPGDARLIMLLDPPTGPATEFFFRGLHPQSVVVIPFGENPAFDSFKSRLTDYGTAGPSGADGPHELWWGGSSWSDLTKSGSSDSFPLIVSCYPRGTREHEVARLTRSLTSHHLDFVIEAVDTADSHSLRGCEKANFIAAMWEKHDRPILWIDPDALLADPPSLLTHIGCDFAVHKWNGWSMSTRTLYFGRSAAAKAILQTWQMFSSSFGSIWDGHVLDQAWSLVSSQMALDTVWLPRTYHAASVGHGPQHYSVVIHNVQATSADLDPDQGFPNAARTARRAGRTGAPEALLLLRAEKKYDESLSDAVTVIIRDIHSAGTRTVAALVEAVARAFVHDSGGFSHLELSLCSWQEEVKATIEVAKASNHKILEIVPSKTIPDDMFRKFSGAAGRQAEGTVIRWSPRSEKATRAPFGTVLH